jgi:hypothetical protein
MEMLFPGPSKVATGMSLARSVSKAGRAAGAAGGRLGVPLDEVTKLNRLERLIANISTRVASKSKKGRQAQRLLKEVAKRKRKAVNQTTRLLDVEHLAKTSAEGIAIDNASLAKYGPLDRLSDELIRVLGSRKPTPARTSRMMEMLEGEGSSIATKEAIIRSTRKRLSRIEPALDKSVERMHTAIARNRKLMDISRRSTIPTNVINAIGASEYSSKVVMAGLVGANARRQLVKHRMEQAEAESQAKQEKLVKKRGGKKGPKR